MSRSLLRLVTWVSLAGYLLANTHISLAVAMIRFDSCPDRERPAKPKKQRGCCHCAQKSVSPEKKQQTSRSDVPCCPDCPRDGRQCPIPGGCALCNVAKTSCLDPLPTPHLGPSPIIERVPESTYSYLQPCAEGVIRPPRV